MVLDQKSPIVSRNFFAKEFHSLTYVLCPSIDIILPRSTNKPIYELHENYDFRTIQLHSLIRRYPMKFPSTQKTEPPFVLRPLTKHFGISLFNPNNSIWCTKWLKWNYYFNKGYFSWVKNLVSLKHLHRSVSSFCVTVCFSRNTSVVSRVHHIWWLR